MAEPMAEPMVEIADPPLPRWPFGTLVAAWSIPALLGVPFALSSLTTAPTGSAPWRALVVLMATWQVWVFATGPILAVTDRFPPSRPIRGRMIAAHAFA